MRVGTVKSLLLGTGILAALVGGTALQAIAQSRDLWLYDGEQATVEGFFYSGESIYGWCDDDCYDLDLLLYDANGNFVTQDVATDANPVVVAPYEGFFTIQVTMPNCSHSAGCAVWVDSDEGF